MNRIFSSQQQQIITAAANPAGGNMIVYAKAGTGKSTVIIEGVCPVLSGSSVYLAFGADPAKEAKERIAKLGLENVKASTCHSAGFGVYRRAHKCIVDDNKLSKLAHDHFNDQHEQLRPFVIAACKMSKQVGIGIVTSTDNVDAWMEMCDKHNIWETLPEDVNHEDGINAAQYLLDCNNSFKKVIDFSDMIYMPLVLNLPFWKYDNVLIDEAQDINPTRREMVSRMLKKGGRLIAVGDENQAIFGFTGADHNSLDLIKEQFNCNTFPLSVTYRCPKAIVKVAQQWVSDYTAHEDAPDGIEDSCELQDIVKLAGRQDSILCRNTKPLVSLAYSLLRDGVACKVEGRKIGEGLVTLAQRWKSVKSVGELRSKVEQWATNEIERAIAKEDNTKAQNVDDKAKTLEVFMSQCDDEDGIAILVAKIRSLFDNNVKGVLTLSTIHKAKGREWGRVFCLGMNAYSPSKFAKKDWELKQEDHLCYVQVTRAKQHLTLVNVPAKVS
jgi:superfamily I DNA/RNA helicase